MQSPKLRFVPAILPCRLSIGGGLYRHFGSARVRIGRAKAGIGEQGNDRDAPGNDKPQPSLGIDPAPLLSVFHG